MEEEGEVTEIMPLKLLRDCGDPGGYTSRIKDECRQWREYGSKKRIGVTRGLR